MIIYQQFWFEYPNKWTKRQYKEPFESRLKKNKLEIVYNFIQFNIFVCIYICSGNKQMYTFILWHKMYTCKIQGRVLAHNFSQPIKLMLTCDWQPTPVW